MKSMGGKGWQSMTGHTVHMRGLPFRSTESDIIEVRDEKGRMFVGWLLSSWVGDQM